MSYDSEELQIGILETFAGATALSRYGTDFGELRTTFRYTDRPITDTELLEEARRAKPLPRIHPPLREPKRRLVQTQSRRVGGIETIEGWRKRVETMHRNGVGVCRHCGARSPTHRCPVFIVGVST